jgi:hypothetical protein
MLLRALVLLLLLANAGYFAWTRGGLAIFGTAPARFSETEPERLAQQLRPQLLQIRKDEAPAAPKP